MTASTGLGIYTFITDAPRSVWWYLFLFAELADPGFEITKTRSLCKMVSGIFFSWLSFA
jgi:hypothetical protein